MKRVALAVMSLCVLVSFHSGAQAEMIVQTCFSPHGKCALHIVRAIESARTEVLVAVYAFTSDDLAGVPERFEVPALRLEHGLRIERIGRLGFGHVTLPPRICLIMVTRLTAAAYCGSADEMGNRRPARSQRAKRRGRAEGSGDGAAPAGVTFRQAR